MISFSQYDSINQRLNSLGYHLDTKKCIDNRIVFYKKMNFSKRLLKIISKISLFIISFGACLLFKNFRNNIKNTYLGKTVKVLIAADFNVRFDTVTNELIVRKNIKEIPTVTEIMDTEGINLLKNLVKSRNDLNQIQIKGNTYNLHYENNELIIFSPHNDKFVIPFVKGLISSLKKVTGYDLAKEDSLKIPLGDLIRFAYKKSTVFLNGQIFLLKNSLRVIPEYHLSIAVNQIIKKVNFLKVDLSEDNGYDAGGLIVDYYNDLMKGVLECKKVAFGLFYSNLLLPQAKGTYSSDSKNVSLCEEEKEIFFNLGKFFRIAYNNQKVLGRYFDERLFLFMLFIPKNDLLQFVNINLAKKVNQFSLLIKKINPFSSHTEKVADLRFDSHLNFSKIVIDELEKDKYDSKHKLLLNCMEKDNWTDDECLTIATIAEVQDRLHENYLCKDGFVQIDLVLKDKEAFRLSVKDLLIDLLLEMNIKDIQLCRLIEPLKAVFEGFNDRFDLIPKINKNNWRDISNNIQGSIDRQMIVNSIIVQSQNSVVLRKVQWLKEWILDLTTTEEDLKSFLKFVVATETLKQGNVIKINEQRGSYSIAPISHTCFNTIDISPKFSGRGAYNDKDKESFLYVLKTYCLENTTYHQQ